MSGWKKLAAASAAGGGALNVEDVFSTYLYTGNSASQPINNGVDLAGEGGMVWLKARTAAYNNIIVDSERGSSNGTAFNPLFTNLTNAENTAAGYGVTSFDDDGFTLGPSSQQPISNQGGASYADINYASWTFRKAPKFFDVVTYTGNGSARTISHSLNTTPGLIICKPTSGTGQWAVWHRSNGNNKVLYLNLTYSNSTTNTVWNNTAPTSTVFSVGASAATNETGVSYVAYLFAHNDGDGEFGADGDQDIIKCGTYTGSSSDQFIDLGFEPQWLMVKSSSLTQDWVMFDTMRGITDTSSERLVANSTGAGATSTGFPIPISANGFSIDASHASSALNYSGQTYIYMAIRRGTKVPESGDEVFDVRTYTGSSDFSSFSGLSTNYVDATANFIRSGYGAGTLIWSRLAGSNSLKTWSTAAEGDTTDTVQWDFTDNKLTITGGSTGSGGSTYVNYFWKRAPGFFDVVAYTGNGTGGRTISHNLGVAPEMMWVKKRSGGTARPWYVYHKGNLNQGAGNGAAYGFNLLNTTDAYTDATYAWNDTEPSSSSFALGNIGTNDSGNTYIAYLFATASGVSKVGSYTGNGSSQTIDCGFTSGARFILVKRTDSTGDWYVWDTERGIVAGNDPYLELNTSDPEVTNRDWVDPDNSGFIVNSTTINASSASYIFYAIA